MRQALRTPVSEITCGQCHPGLSTYPGENKLKYQLATTPSEKMLCYQLRAREYGRRYRNIPRELYQDEFDEALLPNGQSQACTLFVAEDDEIIGTVRLALAYDLRFPDLNCETSQLIKFEGDLAAQLHPTLTPGVTLSMGEIGRLTVSQAAGIRSKEVLLTLLQGLVAAAQSSGINILIGVVAPFVARAVTKTGGTIHQVPNACLNRDTCEKLAFLVKYHEYFLPELAAQHPEVETPDFVDDKTLAELVKLTSLCQDGAQLYWNWTEAFLPALAPVKVET
jgi:hypothetical protein